MRRAQHARNVVCMQNDLKPVKYCGTARSCMLNVPSNAVADRNKSTESNEGRTVNGGGGLERGNGETEEK